MTVTLPDAPSIRLDAGTLEQAMEMGQQALDAHLDACRTLGLPITAPLTIEDLPRDLNAVWGLLETATVTSATLGPPVAF